jgi:hypothetical protein
MADILAMRKSVGSLTGRVRVNGHPATQELAAHISYVPQVRLAGPCLGARPQVRHASEQRL